MGALLHFNVKLHYLECGVCGVPHGLSDQKYNSAMNDGKGWYCPNGHSLVFTQNEKQKLEKELVKEKQRREWAEQSADRARKSASREERRARAYKGVLTKTKNRISKGICPCCNRTFQNLMNHMKLQHPEYRPKDLNPQETV